MKKTFLGINLRFAAELFRRPVIIENLPVFLRDEVPHATLLFAAPGIDVLIMEQSTPRFKGAVLSVFQGSNSTRDEANQH